MQVSDKIEVS